MFSIKGIKREEYFDLRTVIRGNILLNSETVLYKRFAFARQEIEVLMGGIVTAKYELVERIGKNDRLQISELIPKKKCRDDCIDEKDTFGFDKKYQVAQVELKVYDFSGYFSVGGSVTDQSKDLRIGLFRAREGDRIYVLGKIIPMNCPEGYFVLPQEIFNEEEISLYKTTHGGYFSILRERLASVINCQDIEYIGDTLSCYRTSMDVIRLFIGKHPNIKNADYYWLATVIKEFLLPKYPSPKLSGLVERYYKRSELPCDRI